MSSRKTSRKTSSKKSASLQNAFIDAHYKGVDHRKYSHILQARFAIQDKSNEFMSNPKNTNFERVKDPVLDNVVLNWVYHVIAEEYTNQGESRVLVEFDGTLIEIDNREQYSWMPSRKGEIDDVDVYIFKVIGGNEIAVVNPVLFENKTDKTYKPREGYLKMVEGLSPNNSTDHIRTYLQDLNIAKDISSYMDNTRSRRKGGSKRKLRRNRSRRHHQK